ncbi:MAG TPA: hypothetical protein VFZ08_12000 [Terriglobia bacterium]|nr:hypothetical protein [Terriglobia bacterium]
MIDGRILDHVEIDARPVRRLDHRFDSHLLHVDINFGGGRIVEKGFDNFVLLVGGDDVVGEFTAKKVERFREVVVDGVAVAAVIELAELRQKIFRFFGLGLIGEEIVADCLGAARLGAAVLITMDCNWTDSDQSR